MKNIDVFQSESVFKTKIILIESNYDVWLQLMVMHFAKQENLPTFGVKGNNQKN